MKRDLPSSSPSSGWSAVLPVSVAVARAQVYRGTAICLMCSLALFVVAVARSQDPEPTAPPTRVFRQAAPPAVESPAETPSGDDAAGAAAATGEGASPDAAGQTAATEEEPVEEAPRPLPAIERTPFDRLVLTEKAANQSEQRVYEIARIDERRPEMLQPAGKGNARLAVRFLDSPDNTYEIRWADIERIELYEQIVLAEAQQLIADDKPDDAFKPLQYLELYHPDFPGVKPAIAKYLFDDARRLARARQFDAALAVLWEIYDRQPDFPDLPRALAATTGRLIDERLAKRDFVEARRLLRSLSDRYPNDENVQKWSQRLSEQAQERFQQAKQQAQTGQLAAAQELATDAVRIWPTLDEARQFLAEQATRYPVARIGVTSLPAEAEHLLEDWATLRSRRLLHRRLVELADYDREGEGGVYVCPLGQLENSDLGRRLSFSLSRELRWSDGESPITGYDIAAALTRLARPGNAGSAADWSELFAGVEVRDVYHVDVDLRRSHVRPDAMLRVALRPWDAKEGEPTLATGPYEIASREPERTQYRLAKDYFARGAAQPMEVIEVAFHSSREAMEALAQGQIVALDRVNPWELAEVSEIPGVTVAPYGVPSVHCLVPNLKKPFLEQRAFRRALLYAIHREGILKNRLLRGREDDASQVVSGPFPTGYAYQPKLERPYQPQLALTLVGIVRQAEAKKAAALAQANSPAVESAEALVSDAAPPAPLEPVPLPTFKLAHPADEIATRACGEIQRHLKAVGITVELTPLPLGTPLTMLPDYDLLYVELPVWEPVVDARRLLGRDGLAGQASVYLEQALHTLDQASDWRAARDALLRIHLLAAEELTLIPLWQITDYFAVRKELQGVGTRPIVLYQNIEKWQITPWLPPDAS